MSTAREEDVPELIYDSRTQITYKRGKFFGKGGFAKCYEITEIARGQIYAGKIISKKLLDKHNQREKICQEIRIHKTLEHKHVVGYKGFFEDNANIYIILELYRKRSLMELHKRRSVLTEPETRYYMKQILDGVKYLHENRIIHRDLKLGNLFLSEDMLVKIGDFGLATRVEYEGERKKTLCGTPNYIAPEILTKKGHSYEVDIWSSGCIMYTLLIGKPPFETKTLKETYARIKRCEYSLSHRLNPSAAHMIVAMLQDDPCKRPTVFQLLKHEFFNGYTPSTLPASSLIMAPRFDYVIKELNKSRKPLSELNSMASNVSQEPTNPSVTTLKDPVVFNAYGNLKTLRDNLRKLLSTKPGRSEKLDLDDVTDPQAQPIFWVSKWVDYSDKYGFGYQLNDESVGVMFNDSTKIIMLSNGVNIHYINNECKEIYMTADSYPPELDSKIKLLSHFSRYMREHLMKAGASIIREPDVVSRIPHLHQWCRTTSSVIMHLTNGSLQINFHNHTKIILCPLMSAVTYIDSNRDFRTFRFSTIEEHGCSMDLYRSLRYAHDKVNILLEKAG